MNDWLGRVERIEVVVKQRHENAAQFRLLGRRRNFGGLELGDEALQASVELEREEQVENVQRPTNDTNNVFFGMHPFKTEAKIKTTAFKTTAQTKTLKVQDQDQIRKIRFER